jgi:transposase
LLARKEKHARTQIRWLGMMHLQAGKEYDEIALFLGVTKEAVKGWIKRFRKEGLDGLKESPRSGAKRKLLASQDTEFKASVLALQEAREGGRITGKDVQFLLQDTFQVNCVLSSAYNYLHRVGLSWITVRSKHPKQDQKKQDAFKKISNH